MVSCRAPGYTNRAAKIESKYIIQEFRRLHPSVPCPEKVYGAAKLHIIDSKGLVNEWPSY